jgi:hypothetical protein
MGLERVDGSSLLVTESSMLKPATGSSSVDGGGLIRAPRNPVARGRLRVEMMGKNLAG